MATVNEKMTAIADAIRERAGETESLTLDDMATDIPKVYEAGKKSQYDEFWDNFQENGNRTNYGLAFAGVGWNDVAFKPKYKIKVVEDALRMFQNSLMSGDFKQYGVELDFSECSGTLALAFYGSQFKSLGVIDASLASSLNNTFAYAMKLETIEKFVIKEDGTTPVNANTFDYCSQLRNIVVVGKFGVPVVFKSAPRLTVESLMSIINALQDLKDTGETLTLTLHKDSKAKLSESDIATITQKGWTLA